jgi:hypothetical protein
MDSTGEPGMPSYYQPTVVNQNDDMKMEQRESPENFL